MNYSDLNSEIDNKSSLSSIQGQEYRKKYDSITKEGFSNLFGENAVDSKNKSDLNELLELEKKYQVMLSEYLNDYKQLMTNTTQYFDILKSPLINKNIRLTDGTIGYVTKMGIFKPYPSMDVFNNTAGKNGCPSNFTQVEAIRSNNKVTTNPPFDIGRNMELNQSCGNEGKNVFVSTLSPEGSHSYQGCFNGGDGIEVGNQGQLEQTDSFQQCKKLAQIRGKNVFGLNSVENKAMCYVGDDINKIKSNGISLQNIVSWKTPAKVDALYAEFNKAGQLLVKGNTMSTLWRSTAPLSGCDPIYGGAMNSYYTTATWGYNCNSKNFKGVPYKVRIGNVTNKVKPLIENKIWSSYLVGRNEEVDPAYGCQKNFSANYKCGRGVTKSINISGEAGGKIAVFDCKAESGKCRHFLTLQDDGNLVIYKLDDRSVLWNTNTVGKTGVKNEDKMAYKGKYGRHYLVEGDTLSDGEFIASTNGNCYLQMVKGVGLQLIYNKPNCTSIKGTMYGNNTSTIAAYSLTNNDNSNLFKTGYISNESILRPYNQTQLSQTNNYIEIGLGNKNMLSNIDNRIKEIKVNDISECKTSCDKDKNCDGFNYLNYTDKNNTNIKSCALKDKSQINPQGKYSAIYPNNNDFSIIENKLYKRIDNVKNHSSCSKEVSPISNVLYSNYVKGESFTEKDTCGLGKYNDALKKKLNSSLTRLQLTVRQMNEKLSNLSVTDKKILAEHGYNEKKINDNIMSIGMTHQKYLGFKPQFETAKGMSSDTEADMLSKSYNSLLWSILAIMIVIGGIKMTK